ncbi:MAG: acyl--CoA ligase [Deltaproteobacteria bacterium]|nr:acyl--CoA ligase [Deltaproteobacteria bacterium]
MPCKTLSQCFAQSFAARRDKTAIRFLRHGRIETDITYGDLDRDANRAAHAFLDMGVCKGDRVILHLEKSLVLVTAFLGLQKIGAVAVPLNPGFKAAEMAYLAGDAEAALIVLGPDQKPVVDEIDPDCRTLLVDPGRPYREIDFFRSSPDWAPDADIGPEDPGLIIYTSGTTGAPKGAVLTQENLVHDAGNIIRIWEITEADVLCHALPLFHVHGLCFALNTALMAGSSVAMLDVFDPEKVTGALVGDTGGKACSVFMAVPSMYAKLLAYAEGKGYDFDHIRLWTSGSAPLLPRDFERIKRVFGKEPVEREGMSETGMNFSNPIHGARKPGSIGLPLPGLEARIVDPASGADKTPGETGEIRLKGPGISPGYWRKPEETADAFEAGWFRTGDLGNVDEDGYYYLTDRIKHIIISGGENISPKEVEAVINGFDHVTESCVVGMPDDRWGEKVVAAVVAGPGHGIEAQDVKDRCKKQLHDWKCPKEIRFVDELPKNAMGKVLTDEVKTLFES